MVISQKRNFSALGAVLLTAALLSACTSNGPSGAGGNGGITGSSSGGPPNDGTGPTNITDGGTPITGHFICQQSADAYGDATTEVGANGLVGANLTPLLNTLGAADATTLLNSVINANNVIDGNLLTYATTTLAAGLFSVIDSVDLSVVYPSAPSPRPPFAVFAISFPGGTVDLSLLNSVAVTTYLNNAAQESNTLDQSALSLLGVGISTVPGIFFGVETTKPFDRATLSLTPSVLSADVGNALFTYEFCSGGKVVQ